VHSVQLHGAEARFCTEGPLRSQADGEPLKPSRRRSPRRGSGRTSTIKEARARPRRPYPSPTAARTSKSSQSELGSTNVRPHIAPGPPHGGPAIGVRATRHRGYASTRIRDLHHDEFDLTKTIAGLDRRSRRRDGPLPNFILPTSTTGRSHSWPPRPRSMAVKVRATSAEFIL